MIAPLVAILGTLVSQAPASSEPVPAPAKPAVTTSTSTSSATKSGATKANGMCPIAVLDLVPRGLSASDAQSLPSLLADIIANEVAGDSGCQVMSQGDIKGMVDFEASRAQCTEADSSCLAALGEALGVGRVVTGTIGRLGSDYVIALRLVDNTHAQVVGRSERIVAGTSPEQLREAAQGAVRTLFGKDAPAPAPSAPLNPMLIGGVALGVAGVVGAGVGGFLAVSADQRLGVATSTDKDDAFSQGRLGVALAAGGVLALAGGGALTAVSLME